MELNDQELRRLEELELLENAGVEIYPYSFGKTHSTKYILENFRDDNPEALANVCIAGRVVRINRMGKASFFHLQDEEGRIQVYLKKNDLEAVYDNLKLLDHGDILGVSGYVFRTKMGEISIHALSLQILSKCLRPLPVRKEETDEAGNKIIHDAFSDKELRYRRRYVDLIVNPEIRDVFTKRAKIIKNIRNFFDERGWLEVDTPVLQPQYGGATARPFITHHNALDMPFYLRIATELYLKRLIVGGYEGVYEIGKNFRNEGMDKNHNPEFTLLELYVAYKDYNWMMDMTEQLIRETCGAVNGTLELDIDGRTISLGKPFRRAKMFDLFEEYTGRNLFGKTREELHKIAQEIGVQVEPGANEMKILDVIFGAKVEPNLFEPTFVIDYPVEMSPLAKKHRTTPGLVERFELFINCMEMANCFSELNDPRDQRARLEEQARWKAEGDDEAMEVDEDFLFALETGMPPTGGLGIGIDRLVMLLTGQKTIRDVMFFPHMRPEKAKENE